MGVDDPNELGRVATLDSIGMMLGVGLWYGFYGSVLESEAAFEGKTDELCRELGERGKAA